MVDLHRRCGESIRQANEFEAKQREQQQSHEQHQEQPRSEQFQQPSEYQPNRYAALNEAHRQVETDIMAERGSA